MISKPPIEEKTGLNVFSGFKGFTAFNPNSSINSTISTNFTEISSTFSFGKNDSNVLNGAKAGSVDIPSAKQIDNSKTETLENQPKNKNIGENELKFITELSDLYERCYGENKRSYKLPVEVLNESDESSDQETKYACLLAELNRHISKWISKHVEESPLVLLTPVFVDYFNYLILLEKNFFPGSFRKNEKKSDVFDKFTNGTKLPINGTNGHKDSTEKPEIIIEEKPKENMDNIDSNKNFSISFKPTNQPFTPISLDTNIKNTFQLGSVASSEEEKNSIFKTSGIETIKTGEPEKTCFLSTENTLPEVSSSVNDEKISNDQNEINRSKTLFASFSDNTQSSVSLFKFSSTSTSNSENAISKINEEAEKKDQKLSVDESNKFSFSPAGGFFSNLKNKDDVTNEKKEDKKSDEESKKFSFGQTQGSIFSGLKKSEEKQDELKEQSSDVLSFKPSTTTTPFSFLTTPQTAPNKPFFSFGSSEKQNVFSSTPLTGDTKSIFGSTPSPFSTGISFGTGATATVANVEEEEPYEPPKPESSNVKEEGSVYEKRMKLYYFNEKEQKFIDRGIGNLFIKPTKNGESTQLIIRADTSLANILLNVKLTKVFPINKIGPKDVSYICVPNPEIPGISSTSPCKFLFKVKSSEDADELLEKLNEFKK